MNYWELNTIHSKLEDLPQTDQEYFELYRTRAHNLSTVTKTINQKILEELRLAYQKYPIQRGRIAEMAKILKIAVNSKYQLKNNDPGKTPLETMVEQTLL